MDITESECDNMMQVLRTLSREELEVFALGASVLLSQLASLLGTDMLDCGSIPDKYIEIAADVSLRVRNETNKLCDEMN